MKKYLFSILLYNLSWLPFWWFKNEIVTISFNNQIVFNDELRFLAHWYAPFTLVAFIPILIVLIYTQQGRLDRKENQIEVLSAEIFDLKTQLEKRERVKYGSLLGYRNPTGF